MQASGRVVAGNDGWGRILRLVYRSMKANILLIAMLMLAGCGKRAHPAREVPEQSPVSAQPRGASGEAQPSEANDLDHGYAKGVVILKTGEKVSGQYLVAVPGISDCVFQDSFLGTRQRATGS